MENQIECNICLEKMNIKERKPIVLMICGHTCCLYCVNNMKQSSNNCQQCENPIETIQPKMSYLSLSEPKVEEPIEKREIVSILPKILTFHSANHLHEFKLTNERQKWLCDNESIFGACKSGLNKFGYNDRFLCYKCTVCDNFDLCFSCLTAPKVESSTNHSHKFIQAMNNFNWICAGNRIYGKCLSGKNKNKIRYKCTECYDYDLCQMCLNGPTLDNYDSSNHPHKFIITERNHLNWICDGETVYGKCLSKLTSRLNSNIKCTVCIDFHFCQDYLKGEKQTDFDKEFFFK